MVVKHQEIKLQLCAYEIGEYGQASQVIQQQQNGYFMKNH